MINPLAICATSVGASVACKLALHCILVLVVVLPLRVVVVAANCFAVVRTLTVGVFDSHDTCRRNNQRNSTTRAVGLKKGLVCEAVRE